jgi:hypothetical protein
VECYVAAVDASGLKKASLPVQGQEDECPHVGRRHTAGWELFRLKRQTKGRPTRREPETLFAATAMRRLGEQHDTIGRQIYPLGLVLCRRPHVCHAIAEYLVT